MAPAIRIIAALGEGRFGVVFEAQIAGAEYAIKMFKHNEQEALENECRAYHAISMVPSLRSRICRLEGLVDDLPNHHNYQLLPALQLQRLYGDNLAMVITKLSKPKRDELRDHLHHTLDILHNNAELAHGDIRPNNVILEGNFPVLIDFSNAVFKSELNDKLWYSETCNDRDSLNEMFDRVDSSEVRFFPAASKPGH
ncbi:hypothetical protein DIS24_g458 [Lasiodiplodia hormozganensis]|uniref:Protein kinase domain-containing protein n=1 Tax=Lasiodiplodia hormozganensis TaxID=869390 RepID=A0AA40D5U7_9PEZI|nr:hypothetical protein DIS24_g458 [Lasiodiplodia hormozganensis]